MASASVIELLYQYAYPLLGVKRCTANNVRGLGC